MLIMLETDRLLLGGEGTAAHFGQPGMFSSFSQAFKKKKSMKGMSFLLFSVAAERRPAGLPQA